MRFNKEKAKKETIKHCRHQIPRSSISIARQLKKKVAGFYPNSPPKKITPLMKKNILGPLEEDGFLIKYTPEKTSWKKARLLLTLYHEKGKPKPRKITELYQTNFLYLEDTVFPLIKNLPKPEPELNLDLVVLLSKFKKTETYTWDLLNLLLAASKEEDQLRIYLYKLPIDYNKIEILERILEYGKEYTHIQFPFKPDQENAKNFLRKITEF
ncbi:hypothetical protein K8R43_05880 [archaeon]|nr:hypothetical protein [archaeon]